MKRFYSIIAVAATLLSAASCENEVSLQNDNVVYHVFGEGSETKSVLGSNAAGHPQSMWENGDRITIHNGTTGYEFHTSVSDGSPVADFVYEGDDFSADNGVLAVYPAGNYDVDIEARSVRVNIPQEQYAVADSYDSDAVPAVSYSTDNSLHFKNAAALLKFKVGRDDISSFTFLSKGDGNVSGNITCKIDADGDECEVTPGILWVDGRNSVFLSSADNTFLSPDKTYYVAIAPNTYQYGFDVSLDANGKSVFFKQYTRSITIKRNTIIDLGTLGYPTSDEGETILWQGEIDIDWSGVAIMSGGELKEVNAQPGQNVYFYVQPCEGNYWYCSVWAGFWASECLSTSSDVYDLSANGGKIGLTLTPEILNTINDQDYCAFVLTGQNLKVTKITVL